jgi:L-arabinokinase
VRSLEIIRLLLSIQPGLDICIISDLPDFLIFQNVGRQLKVRHRKLDLGLVQKDSLRFDLGASLNALEKLKDRQEEIVTEEMEFLRSDGIQGIVSDIAFLPFLAASRLNLPSVGVSNFTWDWIYSSYLAEDKRWEPLVEWIRDAYRRCGLFLQLPMHGDCSACPVIENVPLVARKAMKAPEHTREILKHPQGYRAYLISFADLDLSQEAISRLESIPRAMFYFKRPLSFDLANGRCLDSFDISYQDVVAAMDAVITKPGYGIVSDCLANNTPMAFTERGPFPESPILLREIERHLPFASIPLAEFYRGEWQNALADLDRASGSPPNIRTDGALICAKRILERLGER